MSLDQWRNFSPNVKLPATWTDGIEQVLGNYVSANLQIDRPTTTTLRVKAGTDKDARVLAIQGKPRWIEADQSAAASGGAGTLTLYAVSSADSFGSNAGPPVSETDTTNHAFTLKIGTPSGTGGEAISRPLATVAWDGTAITGWTPLFRRTTVFRTVHTWAIAGDVKVPSGQTDYIPPLNLALAPGQTARLVQARYRLNNGAGGTDVTFRLTRNGNPITGYTAVIASGTAWALAAPTAVDLADNDSLGVEVTALTGSPQNLSISIAIEHTV